MLEALRHVEVLAKHLRMISGKDCLNYNDDCDACKAEAFVARMRKDAETLKLTKRDHAFLKSLKIDVS